MDTEYMIDIETFGTGNDAVVYQVGMIEFEGTKITNQWLWNLDVDNQLMLGRTITADTLKFHFTTASSAASSLTAIGHNTAIEFYVMLQQIFAKSSAVWSKGSFDFNILENLASDVGHEVPWQFYNIRELRTMMKECGVPKPDTVAHDALQDCLDQHTALMLCREVIANGKS